MIWTWRSAALHNRALAVLIWLSALGAFAAFRWSVRLEPLNSDDLVLFEAAKDAAAGDFWLLSDTPRQAGHRDPLCLSCDGGGIGHQALRTGLLPVAVPLLRWLGPTSEAYYLVPLAFQLLGACAVWAWIRRFAGVGAAWGGFALLALLPYEIDHASRFFVDLPSAACLLWALWLLAAEGAERRTARGVGAGLLLAWAYLLRENSPVLVLPSLALLAAQRERRGPVALALLTLGAVFGLEQLVFVAKGLGVGFRSRMVASALANYAPYLPVYDIPSFAYRQLAWFWSAFGRWPLGALACSSLLGVVALLVWVLARSKQRPLQALAACGLTTWLIFTYAPLRIEGAQIRALAPVSTRYLQPFFYAGFCLVVIAVARAWSSRQSTSWRPWASAPRWAGTAAVVALAVAWGFSIRAKAARDGRDELPLRALLDRVARVARDARGEAAVGSTAIWGPPLEIRVAQLLDGSGLAWSPADLPELRRQVEREPTSLVLRHRARELQAQRYLELGERTRRREADLALDAELWGNHHGLGFASGFTLFTPGLAGCQSHALQPTEPEVRVTSRKLEWRLDVIGGSPAGEAPCSHCSDELRLELALHGVTGQAQVRAARGGSRPENLSPAQPLLPGSNFFAWEAPAHVRDVWIALTLSPDAAGSGQARLELATQRRCPATNDAMASVGADPS